MQKFIDALSLSNNLSTLAASTVALSVPIGFLIHEIDISLFGLIRRLVKSESVKALRDLDNEIKYDRSKYHHLVALLEFSKFRDQSELDAHLNKEVSNRYSYLYARMETGFYAPIAAWLLYQASFVLQLSNELSPSIGYSLVETIILISFALLVYCPFLIQEIGAIETLMVLNRRDEILYSVGPKKSVDPLSGNVNQIGSKS